MEKLIFGGTKFVYRVGEIYIEYFEKLDDSIDK
jgi:hypothetical protein